MDVHPAARWAGVLLVAMGSATTASLLGAEAAPYAVVLGAAIAAGSVAAAVRLWCRRCLQAGWGAVLLCALTVVGQVLVCGIGAPGGTAAGWGSQSMGVVALGVVVPVLLVVAERAAVAVPEEARPYAR